MNIRRIPASLITDVQLAALYDAIEKSRKILRAAPLSADQILTAHCSEALASLDALALLDALAETEQKENNHA